MVWNERDEQQYTSVQISRQKDIIVISLSDAHNNCVLVNRQQDLSVNKYIPQFKPLIIQLHQKRSGTTKQINLSWRTQLILILESQGKVCHLTLWIVSTQMQSTASDSLAVLTMQQSRKKNYRISHQSSKMDLFFIDRSIVL